MNPPRSDHQTVGVRFPIWCAFGHPIMEGFVEYLKEHATWKLVTENCFFGEMESLSITRVWKGDGLITFRATEDELRAWKKRGMAVVLTSSEGPNFGYPRVITDNEAIGRMAADHLMDLAVPHFAFLGRGNVFHKDPRHAPGPRVYSQERLSGFRDRLAEFHHTPLVHHLRGRPLWDSKTWRSVQKEVIAFLKSLPRPCGLFVVDDSLAVVTLRAAEKIGLRVPEDVALLGFGNDAAHCFTSRPTLTSIGYPGREIGRIAAELLDRQLRGVPISELRHTVPPRSLEPRESTDTLAITDPIVLAAVRHIRVRAPHEALRVSEIEDLTDVSPTTLKAKFATQLGHGPKHEIQQTRLRHLIHLLRNTRLSLSEIARSMRFESSHDLRRFLQRATGQRPKDLRSESDTTRHKPAFL